MYLCGGLKVYHDWIAPLFDTFVPLPPGELRLAIESLASKLQFPLRKLEVLVGSKRSTHSNAYFFGFGQNKRIVLFDTLLQPGARPKGPGDLGNSSSANSASATVDSESAVDNKGCGTDEVVAVLSHELGHWSHNHVLLNFVLSQAQLFAMFYLFQTLADVPRA